MNDLAELERAAATSAMTEKIGDTASGVRVWRRTKALGALFWLVASGLAGLNVWWLYRDFRPLPETKEIEDSVWPKRLDPAGRSVALKAGEMPPADRSRLPAPNAIFAKSCGDLPTTARRGFF